MMPNFTIGELCRTATGIANIPGPIAVTNLQKLIAGLELVRTLLGDNPIRISSGFRSPAVNSAVGGSKTSAHVLGFAADFTCPAFGDPRDIVAAIAKSGIVFDQVIWEHPPGRNPWVHISFDPKARRQVLEYNGKAYTPFRG